VDLVSFLLTPLPWNKESKLNILKLSFKSNSPLIAKKAMNMANMVVTVVSQLELSISMKKLDMLKNLAIQTNIWPRNKLNARLTEPKLTLNKLEPSLIGNLMILKNTLKLLKAMVHWLLETMLLKITIIIEEESLMTKKPIMEELIMPSP